MEILSAIYEAEKKAAQIRQQAAAEAREIAATAEDMAAINEKQAAVDLRQKVSQYLTQQAQQAQQEIDSMDGTRAQARLALEQDAAARLEQAATLIYERIMN